MVPDFVVNCLVVGLFPTSKRELFLHCCISRLEVQFQASSRSAALGVKMSRRAGSVVVLGALACLVWGPSFAGSVPRRQESALARMASSKWVNPEDPEMSHPSGLYVLPLKPAKPQENYIYTWKKGEDGSIEDYVKTPFKGPERAADYYTQRKGNGAWDHWGPQGEGEA